MKTFVRLVFATMLLIACIVSESHSSDLLRTIGDGWHSWQVADSERLEVYVLIESGQPQKFRVPSLMCNWRLPEDAEDLGVIDAAVSIALLQRYITPRSGLSSEAMAAISAHAGDGAVKVLEEVVTTDDSHKNREEALFWLAQSDSDAAFAVLDRYLSTEN